MNVILEGLVPFHPLLVHFPIALLVTALIADSLAYLMKNEVLSRWGGFLVVSAALFEIPTMVAGFLEVQRLGLRIDRYPTLRWHVIMGLLMLTVTALVSYVRTSRPARGLPTPAWVWLALTFVLAGLVSVTGFFGGWLVYEDGVGVKALEQLGTP